MYNDNYDELLRQEQLPVGKSLLDAVDVRFGPRSSLAKVFLAAEVQGLEAGVDIRVNSDLDELVAANQLRQNSWGPIVPILDPSHSRLDPDTAFWLSAHDRVDGSLVSTCAVRLLDIGSAGLIEEFSSLRIFYHAPISAVEAGMRCYAEGEVVGEAKNVLGKTGYIGALWTHPRFRGKNLVYVFGKIARALAVCRWDVASVFGVFRVDVASKGVLPNYGYTHLSKTIAVRNSYRGDFDLNFGWMDRARIEEVLADYVAERKVERVTEADDMKKACLLTHGRSKR